VENAGFAGGGVECGQHVLGALAALFRLARDEAGNIGDRASQEMPGNLHMHLAGNRRKVSAEGCSDRDRILGDRGGRGIGITGQCQQNVFKCHGSLPF
jgi:hypothetical protein